MSRHANCYGNKVVFQRSCCWENKFISDHFLAKNQKNTREVTSIEKRLFGFLAGLISDVNDTTGHLIAFDGKQWGYNKNNKEYWDYLKKQSSEKNNESNSKSVSFSVGDSDDEFLFISRKEHGGVEKIHGFQTKNTQLFLKR